MARTPVPSRPAAQHRQRHQKLLTPSPEFSAEHNAFLESIPPHVLELVYVIKEAYRPEGADWRSHFAVSRVNGRPGNRLRWTASRCWSTCCVWVLRPTAPIACSACVRISRRRSLQTEDDITASVVVAASDAAAESVKVVENRERLLFQRPDDAIHPGYDTIAETDVAQPGTFLSNFEPLDRDAARRCAMTRSR